MEVFHFIRILKCFLIDFMVYKTLLIRLSHFIRIFLIGELINKAYTLLKHIILYIKVTLSIQ